MQLNIYVVVAHAKMQNTFWFQLFKYDDLLLFFILSNSKQNIFT